MSQNEEHDKNCNSNAPVVKPYCVCNCRLSKPGPTMSPSMNNPMSLQKESEWEEDSWCVSIVAEAMTFSRVEPIGKDASHITKKLRTKVSQAIATAVSNRENEIAEEVESYFDNIISAETEHRFNADSIKRMKEEVLQLLKH